MFYDPLWLKYEICKSLDLIIYTYGHNIPTFLELGLYVSLDQNCVGFLSMWPQRWDPQPTPPPADLTESCSVYQQCIFVFPNTESVNVTGPSSLSPGLTCCQTTFLQQLPFLTSAALTWLHLTVVRNLFRFSMMKYYTETPGRALLYVLFVIPQLSLCYGWLWLLFYSGVKQHKST